MGMFIRSTRTGDALQTPEGDSRVLLMPRLVSGRAVGGIDSNEIGLCRHDTLDSRAQHSL